MSSFTDAVEQSKNSGSAQDEYEAYVTRQLRKPPMGLGKATGIGAGIGGGVVLAALPLLLGRRISALESRPARVGLGALQTLIGAGTGAGIGALANTIAKDVYIRSGVADNLLHPKGKDATRLVKKAYIFGENLPELGSRSALSEEEQKSMLQDFLKRKKHEPPTSLLKAMLVGSLAFPVGTAVGAGLQIKDRKDIIRAQELSRLSPEKQAILMKHVMKMKNPSLRKLEIAARFPSVTREP